MRVQPRFALGPGDEAGVAILAHLQQAAAHGNLLAEVELRGQFGGGLLAGVGHGGRRRRHDPAAHGGLADGGGGGAQQLLQRGVAQQVEVGDGGGVDGGRCAGRRRGIEQRGGGGGCGVGQCLPVAAQAGQPVAVDGGAGGDGVHAAFGARAQDEAGDEGDEEQPAQRSDQPVAAEGADSDDGEGGEEDGEVDIAQAAAARIRTGVLGLSVGQAFGVGGGGVDRRSVHEG